MSESRFQSPVDYWWDGVAPPAKPIVPAPAESTKPSAKPVVSTRTLVRTGSPRTPGTVWKPVKSSPWSLPPVQKLSLSDQAFPSLGSSTSEHVTDRKPDIPLNAPVKTEPEEPSSSGSQSTRKAKNPTKVDLGVYIEKSASGKKPDKARTVKKEPGAAAATAAVVPTSAVNALDAHAPKKVRGKEREKPRPKKPSLMKKAVLQSRDLKQQGAVASVPESILDSTDLEPSGFSTLEESVVSLDPVDPRSSLHTRHFQPYCDQLLTEPIDELVKKIIDTLVFYQDRAFHQQDPTKFKRRFICGLKDVYKKLGLKEIKLVIMAPDVENTNQPKGPDELLAKIRALAQEQSVPVVYALRRRGLGQKCRKPSPVSVVGVISHDVALADVKSLLELTEAARKDYQARVQEILSLEAPSADVSLPGGPSFKADPGALL